MNDYPKYAKIDDRIYKINTDFHVAIECNKIIENLDMNDHERALRIIYLLFGDKGLDNEKDYNRLLEVAIKYLRGTDIEPTGNSEANDMDVVKDYKRFIVPSFWQCYMIDLDNTHMHYWKWWNFLNGLSEDCILNKVRYIRSYDLNEIKDPKFKQTMISLKEQYKLKRPKEKEEPLTEQEQRGLDNFYKQMKIKRGVNNE